MRWYRQKCHNVKPLLPVDIKIFDKHATLITVVCFVGSKTTIWRPGTQGLSRSIKRVFWQVET
jgi:hypothetical protein